MCNASKDCEVKYSLTMRHKPSKEDDDKGFYEVNVLKKGQHLHKVLNTQLRGDARQDVVDDVLLNHNGSAEDWVNHMVTDAYLAGDDVPDVVSAKRSKNVVRNAVSDYMKREMVSTCWITNVQYIAQTSKSLLEATKVRGYVQKFDVSLNDN